jgi:hypothetical protein
MTGRGREAGWRRQGEGERQGGDRERERGRVETTGRGREAGWRDKMGERKVG